MKKENTQVEFLLQGIKTEEFAVFEANYAPKKETNLNTGLQFKLDQQNKHIGVFLGFELMQSKKMILKISVSCHFKIKETSWSNLVDIKKSKLIIPKVLLIHLAMITIGTTRGVLFAKTESSVLSKFIIPTLNVEEMITEDASFDITHEL